MTVAVLAAPSAAELVLDPGDLEESFTRGSGKGGQHRNKTSTCVVLVHRPSGVRVRIDGGRKREENRVSALSVLRARILAQRDERKRERRSSERKRQVGSGQRGNKVRTVQVQHGTVTDHRTGKRITFKRYERGHVLDLA